MKNIILISIIFLILGSEVFPQNINDPVQEKSGDIDKDNNFDFNDTRKWNLILFLQTGQGSIKKGTFDYYNNPSYYGYEGFYNFAGSNNPERINLGYLQVINYLHQTQLKTKSHFSQKELGFEVKRKSKNKNSFGIGLSLSENYFRIKHLKLTTSEISGVSLYHLAYLNPNPPCFIGFEYSCTNLPPTSFNYSTLLDYTFEIKKLSTLDINLFYHFNTGNNRYDPYIKFSGILIGYYQEKRVRKEIYGLGLRYNFNNYMFASIEYNLRSYYYLEFRDKEYILNSNNFINFGVGGIF